MLPDDATVYLACEGYEDDLRREIEAAGAKVEHVYGRLLVASGPRALPAWAQNVWLEPREISAPSIAAAARELRALQRGWAPYSFRLHRRAALVQSHLPVVSAKPLRFPDPAPTTPLGSWTMIDETTILASRRCSSAFPNGEIRFVENKSGPPSRAYLKLWEAFTLLGVRPGPGDRCVDLGSSPGGWTWALHELGATVVSVDKAPLDDRTERLPRVEHRRESAFGFDPRHEGPFDWMLSDVICYPKRLLGLVHRWIDAGTCPRFVCTIKFQGRTDHGVMRELGAISGSRLFHLFHNRHELTWVRIP